MTENEKVDSVRELMDSISGEIKEEIDFAIFYESMNWHVITVGVRSVRGVRDLTGMILWAEENCGLFKNNGFKFVFKEEKDASLFALKWC